jgi:amidophosphoribosyltransferase
LIKILAIELRKTNDMAEALSRTLEHTIGGYALNVTDGIRGFAVRDPNGIRPLVIGVLEDGGFVTASETSALDTINATYLRDVRPGELVTFDKIGMSSIQLLQPGPEAKCIFERVYFARADSHSDGETYYSARRRDGMMLRQGDDVEADMVIGMPESGTPAAIGYAAASGIPYEGAVIKNSYIGRTFIKPQGRGNALRVKINFAADIVTGKRIVIVDDSAVEGNTMIRRIAELYELGATEVHVRISSPPIKGGCKFGVNLDETRLLARGRTEAEIAQYTSATSWKYLDLNIFKKSIGEAAARSCFGCMDGNYPVNLRGELQKEAEIRAAMFSPAGEMALLGVQ